MVQVAKIFTAVVASAAFTNASQHAKRSSEAVGATEVKAAVESYASLLSNLAANVGNGGESPSNVDLKAGLDTFMSMMASFNELQAPNATGFNPNWEGALIGAAVASQFGAISGALLGVYTDWTFQGFQSGLATALGFDPIATLTGSTPPAVAPKPASPPATVPAVAPKPASPPAASPVAPKAASSPAPAVVAPKPATPAPAPAAKPAGGMAGMDHGGMAGMAGMSHGPQVGAEDWE